MAKNGDGKPQETARAAAAFTAYIDLGPDRSLAKLRDKHVAGGHTGSPSAILRQLEQWSTDHGWQARLKAMAEEQLAEAAELRRGTYISILREYYRRYGAEVLVQAARTDELHGVHDRVKPDEVKQVQLSGPGGEPLTVQFEVVPSRVVDEGE